MPYLDPYRPRAHFDDPNLPYPDGDADDYDPNAGNGGNGGGGNGGNGGGYPGNDPAHNNFNQ